MKHVLLFGLMLASFLSYSQYPASGVKQRLGWQTTGDGLVYRGAIADTSTLDPSGLNNAWMLLDTVNGSLYAYRSKAWQLVSGGGGVSMPFDSVTFNINEGDASEQELKYSAEKGYLQYGGLDSVQIPLLPGIWYVRNDDSVTVSKGMVVRASGTLGASGRIKVKRMIADGSIPAMYVLGIAMHDIASGADGYVMTQGKIRQVNTTAYSEGAVLYADVDTLGGLTQTEPGNGFLKLPIAFVVHSASNGTLAVRVSPGTYLRDLHDAYITSPVSNASLYYNTSESVWRDTTGAVLTSDTSVFARDFQISGTANYIPKFTGANTIGNSGFIENGQEVYLGGTTNAFNFSRFSIYYNPVNNGFPIVADTRAYNASPLPGAGWNFGGKKDSTGAYTAFGAIQGAKETSANSEAGYLQFSTNSDGGSAFPEERMRITSAGNVGIGTTTPTTPLDIRFSGSYPNYYTDTIARVEFNETGAGCCMDITGMYVKANGGGGQSNVGIIGEGGGVSYDKSIGIKGIAKHNDTQGPGIAYGVIGEVSASKLGSSGAIGTTIAGYFKNTAKVDGTHYGVLVETDSSGDYGVYQTGFGANYFKGNVGINTTTPAHRLDVNGDVNTTGMYKKSGTDIISGTTNRLAMFTGANTVGNSVMSQNGDTILNVVAPNAAISTSRYVSQYVNVPSYFSGYPSGTRYYSMLNGSSFASFSFGGTASNNAHLQLTSWTGSGSNFYSSRLVNNSTGDLGFYLSPLASDANPTMSATPHLMILNGGNVGINTTTPTAKLHINNPSSTTPALNIVSNSNVIGSTNDAVSINMQPGQVNQNNTGVRVFNTITGTSAEGNNTGIAVSLNARNSSYGVYSAVSKNWGGSSLFGEAIGVYGSATTDSPAGFSYGGYFKNDTTQGTGFGVFVQTTTPKGSGTVTPLAIQHNSTELMRVQSSGNVGIATSSPSRPLHVNANSSMIIPSGATGTRPASGANGDIRYNTTNANFEWYSGTGWREPVNAARSPAAGLANRFSKFDANGLLDTSAVLVQSNGRIGIGVTPTEALQVNGTARATRFILNTFGSQTLSINNYAPSGTLGSNLWIGSGGQSSSGTSGASGSLNAGIGDGALFFNTTGFYNLAFGVNALLRNTTGNLNVSIGGASSSNNLDGSGNTAIGGNSLSSNTSGSFNIAIGYTAMEKKVTGSDNVAIGREAGNLTAASTDNTASDNSIYIGSSTKTASSGRTGEIVIGHAAVGNGSNTTTIGNTSTTATYLPAGSLYINGTVSPARTLHVNGEARISDLATDTPTRIVGADADGDLGAITLGTGLSISSGTLNASGISSVYIPLNIFAAGDTVKNTTTAKEFFLVHSGLNGYCIDSYTVKAIAGTGSADIQIDKNGTGGNLQSISGTTVYTKDTNIALATGDYIRGQVYNLSGTLVGLGLTLEIKATCN